MSVSPVSGSLGPIQKRLLSPNGSNTAYSRSAKPTSTMYSLGRNHFRTRIFVTPGTVPNTRAALPAVIYAFSISNAYGRVAELRVIRNVSMLTISQGHLQPQPRPPIAPAAVAPAPYAFIHGFVRPAAARSSSAVGNFAGFGCLQLAPIPRRNVAFRP